MEFTLVVPKNDCHLFGYFEILKLLGVWPGNPLGFKCLWPFVNLLKGSLQFPNKFRQLGGTGKEAVGELLELDVLL